MAAVVGCGAEESADTLAPLPGNWFEQFVAADYQINDPRIKYPRFLNFCRKVYNWGNKTFNTYDPEYVTGTGKNWKASLKSYNWMQSYVYNFNLADRERVWLRSGISTDLGVSVNFMAVSLGYTFNVNKWFDKEHDKRNTFNFSFTTALFTAELTSTENNTHGRVVQLGKDETSQLARKVKLTVPVNHSSLNFNAYYFFNHRHYSYAAAYCFSKYQKKSAGTWMLGFDYNRQKINMDFTSLPQDALAALPDLPVNAFYRYRAYNILGGYAHNFVVKDKWLFNITALPAVGYRSLPHKTSDHLEMVSLAALMKGAITFNHRALFASVQLYFNGNFLFTTKYGFMNSTESLTAFVGFRF